MHRKKWVCRQGPDGTFLMIEIDKAGYLVGDNSAPAVHQDTMNPLKHPCDGRVYESRSQYDRVTKAHGCQEIGNDYMGKDGEVKQLFKPRERESVKETALKVLQGYRPEGAR